MKETLAVHIQDLSFAYDSTPVLQQITLAIPSGKSVAILGPNGAGKTTLLKTMVGLIKPHCGSLSFPSLGKGRIAYVPQSESVDWDFPATVLDVVMMGRYGHLPWFKFPGKKERHMAMETLEKVGLEAYHKVQINQLSGGQKQRVFLARALVQEADFYFLDEPFKGVDVQSEKTMVQLFHNLQQEGKTILTVHHDLQTVADYFDWVTLINRTVIDNGTVDQVFHRENLEKTYGSLDLLGKKVSL